MINCLLLHENLTVLSAWGHNISVKIGLKSISLNSSIHLETLSTVVSKCSIVSKIKDYPIKVDCNTQALHC